MSAGNDDVCCVYDSGRVYDGIKAIAAGYTAEHDDECWVAICVAKDTGDACTGETIYSECNVSTSVTV